MYVTARNLFHVIAVSLAAQGSLAEEGQTALEIVDLTTEENRSLALEDYQWKNRLLVVMADTGNDPRYTEQLDLLKERADQLVERDVIVLQDTDPSAESRLRSTLRPRGFAIVLVGKDGQIRLRKPFPWSVREIGRAIDKSPLRQQELRRGG